MRGLAWRRGVTDAKRTLTARLIRNKMTVKYNGKNICASGWEEEKSELTCTIRRRCWVKNDG